MKRETIKRWGVVALCVAVLVAPQGAALAADALPSGLADAALAAEVDAYVEAHRDTTAAVSVAVTRGQQVLFEKAYGFADIAAGRVADGDTVYEWGSVTKLLVWVSVMQLAEQGKLDLKADVTAYLPEGFFTKLRYDAPLSMLNLMHHNAGWEDVLVGIFVDPASPEISLEQALRDSEPNQIYSPGTVCAYSNWSVALAGLIVERISGQSFSDYVREHIFVPLGMEHTALSPRLEDNEWVREHRALSQGYKGLEPIANRFAIPLYPAGMATGTLGDFLRFAQALLPEAGQPTPLFDKADTLTELWTPSLLYGDGSARNCHGFWVLDFGVPTIGHGGNTAAFSAYLQLHPQSNTGMVVMTNQYAEMVYNEGLPELVFGKYEPESDTGALPDARELRGLYRSGRISLHGCTKMYGVLNMIPLFGGDEDTLSASMLGQSIVFNQVAPELFVRDASSTVEVPISVARAELAADGGARLAMPYSEFVRIPTGEGVLWVSALLLWALALVYCTFSLVGGGIRRLILRLRHRRGETSSLRKYHLLLCAAGLAGGLNVVWMAFNLMSYGSKMLIGVSIGLFWLCAAAAVAYLALLALRLRKLQCGRREKALYVVTGLVALVMLFNIVFWQLYRF